MIITYSVHGLHPRDVRLRGRDYGLCRRGDAVCVEGAGFADSFGGVAGFAGGILAYIALEIGAEVAEYVESLARWETLGLFLRDSVPTTAVFAGVFL
jgi:hypothetical protein